MNPALRQGSQTLLPYRHGVGGLADELGVPASYTLKRNSTTPPDAIESLTVSGSPGVLAGHPKEFGK